MPESLFYWSCRPNIFSAEHLQATASDLIRLRFSSIIRRLTLCFYIVGTTSLCNLALTLPADEGKIPNELATSIQWSFWYCNNVVRTRCVKWVSTKRVFSDPCFPVCWLVLHSDVFVFAGISKKWKNEKIWKNSRVQKLKFKNSKVPLQVDIWNDEATTDL